MTTVYFKDLAHFKKIAESQLKLKPNWKYKEVPNGAILQKFDQSYVPKFEILVGNNDLELKMKYYGWVVDSKLLNKFSVKENTVIQLLDFAENYKVCDGIEGQLENGSKTQHHVILKSKESFEDNCIPEYITLAVRY